MLLADVDVLLGKGTLAEGRPEVVDGVAHADLQHAFLLQPPGRGEHLELEGEDDLADPVQPARNVGVLAIERDRGVEAAERFRQYSTNAKR